MSVTPSAELISQGMSIYEALISAINSDKARRFANLIGSSFRLLGNEDVRDLLESRIPLRGIYALRIFDDRYFPPPS